MPEATPRRWDSVLPSLPPKLEQHTKLERRTARMVDTAAPCGCCHLVTRQRSVETNLSTFCLLQAPPHFPVSETKTVEFYF